MNTDANEGMTLEKKISTVADSKNLINEILQTYYGTDNEKEDITRNVMHIQLLLLQPEVQASLVSQNLLSDINDVLTRAEFIMSN